jgi:hypothetical protein
MPLLEREDVAAATKDARNHGKYNRDIQQKVGAGAPFDAPERSISSSSQIGRSSVGRSGAPPVIPQTSLFDATTQVRAEAAAQAAANRTRMRGCEDLLGGYLPEKFPQQQGGGVRRNNSLPPRPAKDPLLPQAMMKLQYDGGSVGGLTSDRAAHLNAKVLYESNRERNQAGVILG